MATIILLIWIISILAVLPIAFFTGIFTFHFVDTPLIIKEICMETWPYPSLHLVYSILLMLVQFVIPITVILVTHTKIIGIVRQRTQSVSSFRNSNRAEVTIRKNKKTTQILLIIAGMFGIHWLPYHIYTIGNKVSPCHLRQNLLKFPIFDASFSISFADPAHLETQVQSGDARRTTILLLCAHLGHVEHHHQPHPLWLVEHQPQTLVSGHDSNCQK